MTDDRSSPVSGPEKFDEPALQVARAIVALPENWPYTRKKAAIQVLVAEAMEKAVAGLAPTPGHDAADAARYRYLKEHSSYYYSEGYDPPTPREFGIQWEYQDCTPARPGMDWLIDQEIEAKRIEALENDGGGTEGPDTSTLQINHEGK